jgi:hypothetical protein
LDEVIPLQMVIIGKVTRSDPSGFAVKLHQYRFHTMKRLKGSQHPTLAASAFATAG